MGQLTSRQEMINTETSNPHMRNWLCANMAIRETSKVLAVSVHQEISQIHKSMQRAIGASPMCQTNCSRFGDGTVRPWCTTCDRWRREIVAICDQQYKPRINWSRLNSSKWPVNPYEVGRAFIPRAHRLYYKSTDFHEDFRFSLSFIENCTKTPLPRPLCEKAWQCRGRVKRKNVRMRMGSQELETTISVMIELLSQEVFGDNEEVIKQLQSLLNEPEDDIEACVVM